MHSSHPNPQHRWEGEYHELTAYTTTTGRFVGDTMTMGRGGRGGPGPGTYTYVYYIYIQI